MSHPVDVYVGKKIRHRRWQLGMTQKDLADFAGTKFQQIQKYETAVNRVSASRLWEIASAQSVSIGYYFNGIDEVRSEAFQGKDNSPLDKQAIEFVRIFNTLPPQQKARLLALVRSIGSE